MNTTNWISHPSPSPGRIKAGFTLIEAIVTIAIIGILAGMMVTALSNASQDAHRAVARQQQAALQGALNSWIGGEDNRVTVSGTVVRTRTIAEMQTAYNQMSTAQRLTTLEAFLADLVDTRTNQKMFWITNSTRIKSRALDATGQYLTLPNWQNNAYPTVSLQ